MNKKQLLFLFALPVLLALPAVSKAATFASAINKVASNLMAAGAGLATIGFVVAGIMYLFSTMNPSLMTAAKAALMAAVIGIVLILLSAGAGAFVKNLFGL